MRNTHRTVLTLACLSTLVCASASCENMSLDGPTDDSASPGDEVTTVAGATGQCQASTASVDVPWISQKLPGVSWTHNMCCGPAMATMVKGQLDQRTALEPADLKATIEWMDGHIAGWKMNNYSCSGTSSDQLVSTLKSYAGVDAVAVTTSWCNLLRYLDGNHIVIFHGDSQGNNYSDEFSSQGSSHWLILNSVDDRYAYIADPGRTDALRGDNVKYTLDSVRRSYEARGSLAVIVTSRAPQCSLPWGGTVASGSAVTAYQAPSVACGGSCQSEVRRCANGVLSGSYTSQSCSVLPVSGGWGPWYDVSSCNGTCGAASKTQQRDCNNPAPACGGASCVGSGTQTVSCSLPGCSNCVTPWGATVAAGDSVTAYASPLVACDGSCTGEVRTCVNGVLSGSYGNQSCSQQTCSGGTPYCQSGRCVECTTASQCAAGASCQGGTCVLQPPPAPVPLSPTGATVVTGYANSYSVTFSWQAPPSALVTSYRIEVNYLGQTGGTVTSRSSNSTSINIPLYSTEVYGLMLEWRVQAYNAAGWGPWSSTRLTGLAVQSGRTVQCSGGGCPNTTALYKASSFSADQQTILFVAGGCSYSTPIILVPEPAFDHFGRQNPGSCP